MTSNKRNCIVFSQIDCFCILVVAISLTSGFRPNHSDDAFVIYYNRHLVTIIMITRLFPLPLRVSFSRRRRPSTEVLSVIFGAVAWAVPAGIRQVSWTTLARLFKIQAVVKPLPLAASATPARTRLLQGRCADPPKDGGVTRRSRHPSCYISPIHVRDLEAPSDTIPLCSS
jgi:hypothetical protein